MRRAALVLAPIFVSCGGGKPTPRPPATPANVVAHAGDGQVTVLWDASEGALGYRVYHGAGALSAHSDVGSVTSWTVVGLANGTAYSFAVSALGTGGESALSATVTATSQANVPIAVTGVTPDGATGVPRATAVVIRFNRPASGVTAGCGGTVRMSDDSFATCADGSFASSDADATWTFTPAAPLHANATYKVRATTGVKDANGIALAAEYTSAGFTTEIAPSLAVTGVDLQHVFVTWAFPASASEARVYVAPTNGVYQVYTSYTTPSGTAAVGPLTPGNSWDLKLTTVTAGVEATANEIKGVVSGFAGTASEWLAAQTAAGEKGGHFRFTWNDTEFFAAYSDDADAATLNPANGDALWIAFDTDPDSDAAGEVRTATGINGGEIVWPFKADYVVELKTDQVNLRTVSSGAWAPLSAATRLAAQIAEIRFPRSAIGNPAKARIAMAAVATHAADTKIGLAFDLAPARATAVETPTTGQYATSSCRTRTASSRSTATPCPRSPLARRTARRRRSSSSSSAPAAAPNDYANHALDDDVINTRTLTWTAGDGSSF